MDQLAEAPARNHAPRNPLVVPDLLGVVLVFLDCSSLGRTAIAIKAAFRVLFGALADGPPAHEIWADACAARFAISLPLAMNPTAPPAPAKRSNTEDRWVDEFVEAEGGGAPAKGRAPADGPDDAPMKSSDDDSGGESPPPRAAAARGVSSERRAEPVASPKAPRR